MVIAHKNVKKKLTQSQSKKAVSKTIVKKSVAKNKPEVETKKVTRQKFTSPKIKILTRSDHLKLLYPSSLTTSEKLKKVLQFAEVEIHDLVLNKIAEAFHINTREFDTLIDWLDSNQWRDFLSKSDLKSAEILAVIFDRAVFQFEDDLANGSYMYLKDTANYVFDGSYLIFDHLEYESSAISSLETKIA